MGRPYYRPPPQEQQQGGGLTLTTLISLVIVFILYVVGVYPVLHDILSTVTGIDPTASALISLVPACLFLGLIIAIFYFAFGRRPPGIYGNM